MRKGNLISLLLILIISSPTWAQLMIKEVSLGQQIEKSNLVLEGKVISKKSFWDINHAKIYTVNTVEVYKVFKGEGFLTIEVVTPGGTVDSDAQTVYPSLKLKIGDTGVFTLYDNSTTLDSKAQSDKKQYKVYGSLQGFYKYDLSNDLVINQFNSTKGITTSFYNEIMNVTQLDYFELANFNIESKVSLANKIGLLPIEISSFSPTTASAGTKSILTINGANFGTTKGNVGFRNADNAGNGFINALDTQVLTWEDTKITVEIPSEAGTGEIRITHNDGSNFTSSSSLSISYAQANIVSDNIAYPTQLVSNNGNGGFTWQMTSDFVQQTEAKNAFERALKTWSCETQMNWDLDESSLVSSSDAMHKSILDNKNVLAFDNSASANAEDDLPDTVLGQRTSYYSRCTTLVNGSPVFEWYVKEFDIVFDDEINWNFNSQNPSDTEYDFESVALHELGHCRQLDHIIDTNNVMHYAITKGESLRNLDNNNIELANLIHNNSTDTQVCNQELMTNYSGSCALGIEEDELSAGIKMYPNPTKGDLYISNNGAINLEKVVIYDVSGRVVAQQDFSNGSRLNSISLTNVSKGVFFVTIHSDVTYITKKLIVD
ncbi:T9SS type A sorting domain-containing protein [Algibacter sp.]|uniref:T9SS type A sorting domain-containing protein n=1 Tax=Algibacter sp. TaxID=1872428 RepID=UPI003C74633D